MNEEIFQLAKNYLGEYPFSGREDLLFYLRGMGFTDAEIHTALDHGPHDEDHDHPDHHDHPGRHDRPGHHDHPDHHDHPGHHDDVHEEDGHYNAQVLGHHPIHEEDHGDDLLGVIGIVVPHDEIPLPNDVLDELDEGGE